MKTVLCLNCCCYVRIACDWCLSESSDAGNDIFTKPDFDWKQISRLHEIGSVSIPVLCMTADSKFLSFFILILTCGISNSHMIDMEVVSLYQAAFVIVNWCQCFMLAEFALSLPGTLCFECFFTSALHWVIQYQNQLDHWKTPSYALWRWLLHNNNCTQ